MEGLLGVIVLFVVIVLVLRTRSNYSDAHPDTCDICGNKEPMAIKLKDGHMCYQCAKVKYMYKTVDLALVMKDSAFKKYTVAEMKDYLATIRHRGGTNVFLPCDQDFTGWHHSDG